MDFWVCTAECTLINKCWAKQRWPVASKQQEKDLLVVLSKQTCLEIFIGLREYLLQ